jgi:hypothetical protein
MKSQIEKCDKCVSRSDGYEDYVYTTNTTTLRPSEGKKGKVRPETGHEGPEGE